MCGVLNLRGMWVGAPDTTLRLGILSFKGLGMPLRGVTSIQIDRLDRPPWYLSVTRGCSHIGRPSRILSLGRELRPMSVPERTGVALVKLSVDPCAVMSFEILGVAKTEGGDGNGWRRGLVYD